MLSRTCVQSYVKNIVDLETACPAAHTDAIQAEKAAELKDSANSRPSSSSLSKFVQRISGVMKNKKKVKRHSRFYCPHLDSGFGNKVSATESNLNRQLTKRLGNVISRRRSGNDVVFVADSCVSRLPADRPMSQSVEHICVPCAENATDRPQSSNLPHNEKTRPRYYRKSISRGPYVSPRKFDMLPSPFTHKKASSPFKQLVNQKFDSCSFGELSLPCIRTFGSSNNTDLVLPEPCELLNQTVEWNNCHEHTLNPTKPVCGVTDMEGTELEAARGEHNIHTDPHEQGRARRVASWAAHFDKLLQDPLGIHIFTKFLEKEFSAENIRFWQVCQQFRALTDERQQQALAMDIYDRHIAAQASDPVNIDGAAKWHTLQFLDNPAPDMFDVAQSQIQRLMKLDSYPRFLKSDLYKNVLLEEMEGRIHYESEKMQELKQGKKQNAGKENGGKRRRSLLPWMRFL
ncbi:hypothetical protein BsWGS_04093 [Bradybaena similaris]